MKKSAYEMSEETKERIGKASKSVLLRRIQKYFPQVDKVVDATENVKVSVAPKDIAGARRKDPMNCALARAYVRNRLAEGAIINIGYSYLINGDTAIRYRTSQTVAREITAFDRAHAFEVGTDYHLDKVPEGNKLNKKHGAPAGPKLEKKEVGPVLVHHRTVNIRKRLTL